MKLRTVPKDLLLLTMVVAISNLAAKENETASVWLINFEQSLECAMTKNKPILMVFAGSDWCKPCIKLTKEVFESDLFKKFARESLVLLRLDFPRSKKNRLTPQQIKHNEKLADEYNKKGDFPLVVLLSPQRKVLATTGYRRGGPKKYIDHLKSLISRSPRDSITDGIKQ